MPSVDDRIVRMEFDNASFERNINTTLTSLAELDKALKLTGAQEGLNNIAGATNQLDRLDVSHLGNAIDSINSKFSALGAVAFTAIQSITLGIFDLVKSAGGDVLGPIISGGTQRAKNIQQAQFMFEGLGIDIQAGMQSALDAVLGTAFGLDEAAKAAAQFGASGIQVGAQMTAALRGVAGAAAMTGTSFTEMADIFAGSAGTGRVTNIDLQQFATRGLNAAAAIGKVMGKTEAQIHEMAASGELDFVTFADAMDKAFGAHATEANKTYTGSLSNMHAAMSRLGASFMGPQLLQQRDLFNALTPVIDKFSAAIKPLVDTFSSITGVLRGNLITKLNAMDFGSLKAAVPAIQTGMMNIFLAFQNIVAIGKRAFENIFPPGAESLIIKLSNAFRNFTSMLLLGTEGATKLQSIFQGFFSVMSIGWEIMKDGTKFVAGLIKQLLALGGPGVTSFFAKIGESLTKLQESLVKGGGIADFFTHLTEKMQKPIELLKKFKDALGDFFNSFDPKIPAGIEDSMNRISDRFSNLKDTLGKAGDIWQPFENALSKITAVLDKIWIEIRDWFKELGKKLAAAMSVDDFNAVLDLINVGLLGGIAALLTKFVKGGLKLDLGGGLFAKISGAFEQLTGVLKAMQTNVRATALLKIAGAIAIITASVLVLSMIDSAALTKALSAMAVGFTELMGTFAILTKLSMGPKAAASFSLISGGLILLSTAILILAGAVKILSTMSWEDLSKGMLAITLLLGGLVIATKPLAANSKGMIAAGVAITAIAVGLTILAIAVKIFGTMSWEKLAKGLLAVGLLLAGIAGAMHLMPSASEMLVQGLALIAIAFAMNLLAGAVAIFGTMRWEKIAKGLVGIAGGLLIIAGAMHLMPEEMIINAAALLIIGIALNVMGAALKIFASMSWEQIAKGLVTLAGALLIIAGVMHLMEEALPGAAALLIVSFALGVLATVLKVFGNLDFGTLLESLAKLAVALLAIALISDALSESIPVILALGIALMALGAGFALFGLGVDLIGKGLKSISEAGKGAAVALKDTLVALGEALPALATGIAKGIVAFVMVFVKAAPVIAKALGVLLDHIMDTLVLVIPKLTIVIGGLIDTFIALLNEKTPGLIAAGLLLLINFLKGVRDNIEQITSLVSDIIVKFLDEMNKQIPRISESLVTTIQTALISAANGLGQIAATILYGVGIAFIEGFWTGMQQAFGPIVDWLVGLGSAVFGFIGDVASTLWKKGWDLLNGLWNGISNMWSDIWNWFSNLGQSIIDIIPNPLDLLKDLGSDIMNGLWKGIRNVWHDMEDWLGGVADAIGDFLTNPLGLWSPSRVMKAHGENIMMGLHIGMQQEWKNIDDWLEKIAPMDNFRENLGNSLTNVADQMSTMEDFNPTITPVLDLTRVAQDASRIGDYIQASHQLVPAFSFSQAKTIANAQNAQKQADISTKENAPGDIRFQQIINAPTRLSTSDIYKQTRNQITMAKEELSIP